MSRMLFVAKSLSDANTHEQTIICRQLFADHVLGSRPMKRKEKKDQETLRLHDFVFHFLTLPSPFFSVIMFDDFESLKILELNYCLHSLKRIRSSKQRTYRRKGKHVNANELERQHPFLT